MHSVTTLKRSFLLWAGGLDFGGVGLRQELFGSRSGRNLFEVWVDISGSCLRDVWVDISGSCLLDVWVAISGSCLLDVWVDISGRRFLLVWVDTATGGSLPSDFYTWEQYKVIAKHVIFEMFHVAIAIGISLGISCS